MRIVVWNCAMGLHEKWERLVALNPDVAIVPECAMPEIVWASSGSPECASQWVGRNRNKGLGIFAFHGRTLSVHESYSNDFEWFLPVTISGNPPFSLLAVWAFGQRTPVARQFRGKETVSALRHYKEFLTQGNGIAAGDFNNSVFWDKGNRLSNFAAAAQELDGMGLASAYHEFTGENYGKEQAQTLFWMKGKREYHIDYCFLPKRWTIRDASIGKRDEWIAFSDHAPLCVDCSPELG